MTETWREVWNEGVVKIGGNGAAARKLGVSEVWVSKVNNGKSEPSSRLFLMMCKAAGFYLDRVMQGYISLIMEKEQCPDAQWILRQVLEAMGAVSHAVEEVEMGKPDHERIFPVYGENSRSVSREQ